MIRHKYSALSFTAFVCAISTAAHAQLVYRLIPVAEGQDHPAVQLTDMNDERGVVGVRAVGDVITGFLWDAGTFTQVGNPRSDARGINDSFEIVGVHEGESLSSFLFHEGELTDIDAGPNTVALGLNNRTQVIGQSSAGGFLWQDGSVTTIQPLPGDSGPAIPLVINNKGLIAGISISGGESRAFLWKRGKITELSGFENADREQPLDMNVRGQILVEARFETGTQWVVWDRGRISVLPFVYSGQTSYTTRSINDDGEIVGNTFGPEPGANVPTLWRRGRAHDLNTLVASDDPLKPFVTLVNPRVINNEGDILIEGFDSRRPGQLLPYVLVR